MKIAIEAQRIFRKNKHGMDFVALESIRHLQEIDKYNEYRIYVAPGEDRCLSETENFKVIELDTPTYPLWEQFALPRAVDDWGADLLHCTSNTAPLRLKTKLIITLHDVIFMEGQSSGSMSVYQKLGRVYRRYVVPRVVEKCDRIVTVSNYEKSQIINQLRVDQEKIEVIYNGFNNHFAPTVLSCEMKERYNLPDRYILFLGNTDPKKNAKRLFETYSIYLKMCDDRQIEPASLVVGDLSRDVVKSMVSRDVFNAIEGHLVTCGYICNGDLPQIYSGAEVFLYPSLRESFGIPLLESMACGVAVVSSNGSAIPEIVSESALLVDPKDGNAIAKALLEVTTDNSLKNRLIECGFENVKRFSWTKTAHQLLDLYKTFQIK